MTNGKLTAALQWAQRTASGGVPDSELLQRFTAGGDEAAFELILWRHQRLVFGVCRRVLHNLHDAEDAFQAAFLVLARKGHTIGRGESLAAWLYRVAHRCALTVRTRQARREQTLVPDRDVLMADDTGQSAEGRELRDILDEELQRLPETFRVPAILCYLAGKTVDEAAEHIGCPRGTVASRLARARERLRVRLTRRGVVLPAGAAALALAEATASAAPDALIRTLVTNFQSLATGRAATESAAAVADKVVRAMFVRKMLIGSLVLALCASVFMVSGSLAAHALAQLPDAPPVADPVVAAQAGQPAPKAQAEPGGQAPPLSPQEYAGRLEASQVMAIRSRAGGVVEKVAIKVGDTVKRGDLLMEIDAKAARVALKQAEATLAAAEAMNKYRDSVLKRRQELFRTGAIEEHLVEESAATAAAAKQTMESARALVAQARLKYEYTQIIAPIDGRVSQLKVDVGDVVGGDGKAPLLATLIRTDPMTVTFQMDEATFIRFEQQKRAGKVASIGLHLRIPAADERGFPHAAKFTGFAPTVDATTGTIAVRGTMANPQGEFLPGMSVRVRVTFAGTAKRK
jgi:RND family efflux transporter MFP subunit